MKKLALFVLVIVLTLSFVACAASVTPVAYTRYIVSGEQYVYYSSDVYGLEHGQIEVWKNKEESEMQFGIADLCFRFTKCLGADDLDDYRYTLVDLSNKTADFKVDIYKGSDIYDENKKIYLNGEELTPVDTYNSDVLLILTFENVNFIRTNSNGSIDNTKVNTLEYKY